jgi:hypothetical protein
MFSYYPTDLSSSTGLGLDYASTLTGRCVNQGLPEISGNLSGALLVHSATWSYRVSNVVYSELCSRVR